jgi:DNA-binding response OmpR family regulator
MESIRQNRQCHPFLIPTRAAAAESTTHLQPRENPARQICGATILWIDDKIHAHDPVMDVLRPEAIRVDVANTAAAGLALARTSGYHLIILDLRLPDASGLAVLEHLRNDGITTPVLVLTGYADFESARLAGAFGAVRFEAKPLWGDDLLRVLRTLLAEKGGPAGIPDTVAHSVPGNDQNHELRRLIAMLDLVAAGHELLQEQGQADIETGPPNIASPADVLLYALVRSIVAADTPLPVFLACAEVFRNGVSAGFGQASAVRARLRGC